MFTRAQAKRKSGIFADPITIGGIETQLDIHQIEVTAVDSGATLNNAGTIAFEAKGSAPNAQFQPVQKDGAPFVLDLSTEIRSFEMPNASITAIKGTPVGIGASAGTEWTLNIISGRKG
jgi:hypothetical protein